MLTSEVRCESMLCHRMGRYTTCQCWWFIAVILWSDLRKQAIEIPSPYGDCDPSEDYVQTKCLTECEANYVINNCSCKFVDMPGKISVTDRIRDTSAKENVVWIRSPYSDTDSGSGLLPKCYGEFPGLVQGYICDHSLQIYKPNCRKMSYLAMLKNPSKNCWIRIRKRMTSKIYAVLPCPQIHLW